MQQKAEFKFALFLLFSQSGKTSTLYKASKAIKCMHIFRSKKKMQLSHPKRKKLAVFLIMLSNGQQGATLVIITKSFQKRFLQLAVIVKYRRPLITALGHKKCRFLKIKML